MRSTEIPFSTPPPSTKRAPFDRPVGDGGSFSEWDAATAPAGTITYDANGNLTELDADPYHLTGLVYDERNLPTQIEAGEGDMAHYRYSAAGQRTYKQVGSQPAEHDLLDGAATVGVVAGGSVRFANLLTPDGRVIGRYTANLERRYYYTDHLGSTRAVVDGSGTVVETPDYYPYGLRMPDRTLAEASSAKEDYTGHERDAETSLHYAGARYYMSALGRWTSVDPLADEFPAWSGYHYSYNNPLGFIDPDGMASCDITLCGQNGSSVTIETDLVDVEVDVSSLPGTDFGGNHTIGGRDVVLAGLDLAGTVDPTPVSDGLAASMYVEDGDYGNVALSALGFIPAFGDVGKLARVGKHIDAVRSALNTGKRGDGLTANPFKGKSPKQIEKMFEAKDFEPRGPDPLSGKGGYVNPKSGYSYHIDPGGTYKKGIELPHVDVNYPHGVNLPKKKLPIE